MTEWLVLIESNTTGTGPLFVEAARRLGLRPLLVAREPSRYPYVARDRIDVLQTDTTSDRLLRRALETVERCGRITGVTTSSEYFVAAAARLARSFDLPGPSPHAVSLCRDKERQRRRLRAAGVPQPVFRSARTLTEAVAAADALGYSVVVKPVDGTGSLGVRRCDTASEVRDHAAWLLARGPSDRGVLPARRVLVERCVAGPEYSVELFDGHVVGITRKHVGAPPHFVEIGHDFPASLSRAMAKSLSRCARAAAAALGVCWGPAHLEVRRGPGGPAVMEMNARLAGGLIPTIVRLATGTDLIQQTIERATGRPVSLRPTRCGHAGIRFFLAPHEGTLDRVDGLVEARSVAHIREVQLYVTPGAMVFVQGDYRDRIGHLIAAAATARSVTRSLARACTIPRFSVISTSEAAVPRPA